MRVPTARYNMALYSNNDFGTEQNAHRYEADRIMHTTRYPNRSFQNVRAAVNIGNYVYSVI